MRIIVELDDTSRPESPTESVTFEVQAVDELGVPMGPTRGPFTVGGEYSIIRLAPNGDGVAIRFGGGRRG